MRQEEREIINAAFTNKCPICDSELEWVRGLPHKTDFYGCTNYQKCGYKGLPSELIIHFLKLYVVELETALGLEPSNKRPVIK
jgi:ssDNA-binding Zn-finger/Zn-ribbon topoisomerase 1